MKRMIFLAVLCLMLTGCSQAPAQPEPSTHMTESVQMTTPPNHLTYSLYLPNDNADGFDVKTVHTLQIDAESVLEELKAGAALTQDVKILNFSAEGACLKIDFNEAFAELMNSTGTAGERMICGSVVNTFLSAYQADSVFITAKGEILETGHTVYDFPLTQFE